MYEERLLKTPGYMSMYLINSLCLENPIKGKGTEPKNMTNVITGWGMCLFWRKDLYNPKKWWKKIVWSVTSWTAWFYVVKTKDSAMWEDYHNRNFSKEKGGHFDKANEDFTETSATQCLWCGCLTRALIPSILAILSADRNSRMH